MKELKKKLNSKRIISLDAETNGLWGQAFCIAAVMFDEGGERLGSFIGRCNIEGEVNPWVAENVLPKMAGIPVTYKSYRELLEAFFEWYRPFKDHAVVLTHMGHIVEAKLLCDAHSMGIIGDWDALHLWYDCCLFFDDSTDTYCKENGIELPRFIGGTHDPLYDCYSAYRAFKHFVQKRED